MFAGKTVSVIGAGTMGNGIAHIFALGGFNVNLIDLNSDILEKASATIDKNLQRQVSKEKITAEVAKETMGRLKTHSELSAASDSFLIIEAVSENPDIKKDVFKKLDEIADPDAILASNTSSISITQIGAYTKRPHNVIGMHFMNPVPVMKLVEIIKGLETSDECCETITQLCTILNKVPVTVNDYPGFVSNRILMPMINEAIYCIQEGVADKEAIDTVMKLGMAHPMGPLALADLIGLDVCLSIMEVLHIELGDSKYRPCPLLKKMVAANRLGKKNNKGFYDYN